ncbi:MAG: DUF2997 domain-containing protein [Lentisphaerae bacterium]|jgi:hypothetical protein|nr:DUF2997 domain-containing protein [Lentisphaerota bacterium]MBT5608264.1 DUF2997 domain-containing protein [Lentisphaerota bacterium]MBT7840446.1 DUF2997 domain-containing protein [Lentisphaerota bacterium]
MARKTIELTVEPNGQINIEAVGFSGPDCEKATAFLEQVLGETTDKRHMPDYYRRAHVQQRQRLG